MTRYPLILRSIHWFTALMFIPMMAGGYFWLRTMSSTDPTKLDAMMHHMAIGVFLVALALTLVIGLHIVAAMRDSDKIKRMA